jgi:hypothetical protein
MDNKSSAICCRQMRQPFAAALHANGRHSVVSGAPRGSYLADRTCIYIDVFHLAGFRPQQISAQLAMRSTAIVPP